MARAHGIRGELRCVPLARADEFPTNVKWVQLLLRGVTRVYAIESCRVVHGGVLLRLEGVSDRTAAEQLAGAQVSLARDELAALAPGEFYLADLIGADVVDDGGVALGTLAAVRDNGAQPLLAIRHDTVERLLPLVADTIVRWDATAGLLTVRTVPGLWETQ